MKRKGFCGRRTLQQGNISAAQTGEGLIAGSKQSKVSFLSQEVSQTSSFHQRQKDPAVQ